MNNKGWGLNDLLIGLGILGFALILATVLFQSKFKEIDTMLKGGEQSPTKQVITYTYEEMESEMVVAATQYIEKEFGIGNIKGSKKITMETLYEKGLYTHIYDPEEEENTCTGYVLFQKKNQSFSYTPYIKCSDNYQTKGYK